MIREKITLAIQEALKILGVESEIIALEHPSDIQNGDFSSNVAMVLAQKEGKNPKNLAKEIVRHIERNKPEEIERVEVAGSGFINFYLSESFFIKNIENILQSGDKWGSNGSLKGKKIMVEYTDPNPFKEFHIGHLMSNAIGESISRLIEFSGAEVKRANYQGDVGPHVAKAIWGLQQMGDDPLTIEKLGAAYVLGAQRYEENVETKAEIDALNKTIYEQNNKDVQKLYEEGRALSLKHFEELYTLLGTTFDYSFFESETWKRGLEIVKAHPDVFEQSEGATIFRGTHTRVFIASHGFPTYEAKDLGLLELKKEKEQLDESITITANEQSEYFRVMLEAARKIPEITDIATKTKHISHGMMRFADGKMSSRKGNIITGASLLGDVTIAAQKRMQERDLPDTQSVAEVISVAAIKYGILKQSSGKNIIFNEEQWISFEGDSGPYLQYTNARIVSLLEKAELQGIKEKVGDSAQTTQVERLLPRFPEVVLRAVQEYEPHYVTTYLTELAGVFNSWYGQSKILDGTDNAPHKLAIAHVVSITLKNGLWLLGIKAPQRM